MLQTQGRIMPLEVVNQYEVINFFAQSVTGERGQFVALFTGQQTPDNASANGYTTTSLGTSYQGTYAPRYENKRKFRPTAAGDTKYNTIGITLYTTAEEDENGQKIALMGRQHREERGYAISGETVPVLSRGIVTLRQSAYVGTPIPGYVGLITGNGQILVHNPATLPVTGGLEALIAGRFLSTSGDAFGGYAQFKLEL